MNLCLWLSRRIYSVDGLGFNETYLHIQSPTSRHSVLLTHTVLPTNTEPLSLLPSPLPQIGCHCLEDGLGNCVHIHGTVACHSQNLECPIGSSEMMALCISSIDGLLQQLATEMLALVDLRHTIHMRISFLFTEYCMPDEARDGRCKEEVTYVGILDSPK